MNTSSDIVESIWRAGVQAVDSRILVEQSISITADALTIAGVSIPGTSCGGLKSWEPARPGREWLPGWKTRCPRSRPTLRMGQCTGRLCSSAAIDHPPPGPASGTE